MADARLRQLAEAGDVLEVELCGFSETAHGFAGDYVVDEGPEALRVVVQMALASWTASWLQTRQLEDVQPE